MSISFGELVISAVTEEGQGYFEHPTSQPQTKELPGGATIRMLSNHSNLPVPGVRLGGEKLTESVSKAAAVSFIDVIIAPHQETPMHATPSIDYGVVVEGELWIILDTGEEKLLKTGDVYIQKAANHAWANRSGLPARYVTMVVAAQATESLRS